MAVLRATCCALLVAGCSQSLVDDSYRGVPRITLQAHANDMAQPLPTTEPVGRVSLFWNPGGLVTASTPDALVEQPSNGLTIPIPGDFQWSLYDPPPPEVLAKTEAGGLYALAIPAIYLDQNNNGRHEANETMVAASGFEMILYAPVDLDATSSPTGYPVPAGYHIVTVPLACHGVPPPPMHPRDCGVPLGHLCQTNMDCGMNGVCLTTEPLPWPGGSCAVASTNGCQPQGGTLLQSGHSSASWWVQGCTGDADCRGGVYQCDVSKGACLPTNQVAMRVGVALGKPFCGTPAPTDGGMGPGPDGGMGPGPDGGMGPGPDGGTSGGR
jgi:hypothetical protein